jgi:hypothetical protein
MPVLTHAPGTDPVHFSEEASAELVWAILRARSEFSEKGRALFQGTLAQRNTLWKQLRSLIHQGQSYYSAATTVAGSSSALLYYYAFLNLAKAELLRTQSSAVLLPTVRHGLLFRAPSAGGLTSGSVEVTPGVFSMLYEVRTGLQLAPGTRLPIRRLLSAIPEIGWEVGEVGRGLEAPLGLSLRFSSTRRMSGGSF